MANPYHDKEGKFTSRDKQGQGEKELDLQSQVSKINSLKLPAP